MSVSYTHLSYIAIDPSLWWDRGVFLHQAAKNVYQKDFSGKHLYVAFATRQRPAIKPVSYTHLDVYKRQTMRLSKISKNDV